METQSFRIDDALSAIPQKKVLDALEQNRLNCETCAVTAKIDDGLCKICQIKNKAILKYAEANIPVRYWPLEIERDFTGDGILLEEYQKITKDLYDSYRSGITVCFAGGHGLGKTLTCCNILKRVVEKGLTGTYCNLNDIINVVLNADSESRQGARRRLLITDFLVIDEFDPRYMANDKASAMYGRILEEIFRTRHQNCLPTLMCTNSPNVVESFTGPIKESIKSLMSVVTIIPVMGSDFRKKLKK